MRSARARYEVRAWSPSPRSKRGEILSRTMQIWTNDPHYAAVELYRLEAEQRASGAYGSARFRYEVIDHGTERTRRIGTVMTYRDLVARAKSLVARDPSRRRVRRRSRR